MSEDSSGSGNCVSCGHMLPTPAPKFCGECGAPQRKTKECVKCKKQLAQQTKFCVHCGHNQQEPVPSDQRACIKCGNGMSLSETFCGDCGHSNVAQTTSACLLCGTLSVGTLSKCFVCHAPSNLTQDSIGSIPLKQCINPSCCTALLKSVQNCYKCDSSQIHEQSLLSPQFSNTSASFLHPSLSLPNMITTQWKYCINYNICRGVLTEPTDVCNVCNSPQPIPTPPFMLILPSPSSSYRGSPNQTSPQFPKIAAKFPSVNQEQLQYLSTEQGIGTLNQSNQPLHSDEQEVTPKPHPSAEPSSDKSSKDSKHSQDSPMDVSEMDTTEEPIPDQQEATGVPSVLVPHTTISSIEEPMSDNDESNHTPMSGVKRLSDDESPNDSAKRSKNDPEEPAENEDIEQRIDDTINDDQLKHPTSNNLSDKSNNNPEVPAQNEGINNPEKVDDTIKDDQYPSASNDLSDESKNNPEVPAQNEGINNPEKVDDTIKDDQYPSASNDLSDESKNNPEVPAQNEGINNSVKVDDIIEDDQYSSASNDLSDESSTKSKTDLPVVDNGNHDNEVDTTNTTDTTDTTVGGTINNTTVNVSTQSSSANLDVSKVTNPAVTSGAVVQEKVIDPVDTNCSSNKVVNDASGINCKDPIAEKLSGESDKEETEKIETGKHLKLSNDCKFEQADKHPLTHSLEAKPHDNDDDDKSQQGRKRTHSSAENLEPPVKKTQTSNQQLNDLNVETDSPTVPPTRGNDDSNDPGYSTPPESPLDDGYSFIAEESNTSSKDSKSLVVGTSKESNVIAYKKEEQHQVLSAGKDKRNNTNNKETKKDTNGNEKNKDEKKQINSPVIWKESPTGFSKPVSKMVAFYAILPTSLWEWDSSSEVYIRFGHTNLGNWRCDSGPMIPIRDTEDGCIVLHQEFPISANILKAYIPYKYTVYTPKTRHAPEDDVYEYIQNDIGVSSDYANRVLCPETFANPNKGVFRVFDSVICPRVSETVKQEAISQGWWNRSVGFVKTLFSGQNPQDEATPATTDKSDSIADVNLMRRKCLEIYLKKELAMIRTGNYPTDINLEGFVDYINSAYSSLLSPFIHDGKRYTNNPRKWICQPVYQEVKNIMISLIDGCKAIDVSDGGWNRMMSASVVTCCLEKVLGKDVLRQDAVISLLELFILTVDIKQKQCPAMDFLLTFLPVSLRNTLLFGLTRYCRHLMKINDSPKHVVAICNVLAIGHCLRKSVRPFDERETDPRKWMWPKCNQMELNLIQSLKQMFCNIPSPKLLKEYYESLKPLFVLDQLLLPNFLYCCSINDIQVLSSVIPPCYTIAWMAYKMNAYHYHNIDLKTVASFHQLNKEILNNLNHDNSNHPKETLSASSYLLEIVTYKLSSSIDVFLSLYISVISLVLKCLNELVNCADYDTNQTVKDTFGHLRLCINKWISSVFGSLFGGGWRQFNSKHVDEFKVWNDMLSMSTPSEWQKEFQAILVSIIKPRIDPFYTNQKIDLFITAEKNEMHPEIVSLLMNELAASLEVLMLGEKHGRTSQSIEKLQKSKHIGILLGNMLNKKFPKFVEEDSLTIDDILEWEYWPTFMQIYGQQQTLPATSLSDKDTNICGAAITIFLSVLHSLFDGSITVDMLKKLQSKQERVNNLVVAIDKTSLKKESVTDIKAMLLRRLHELKHFMKYQVQMQYLCHQCHGLDIQEMPELIEELKRPFDTVPISEICYSDETHAVNIHCFIQARPLDPFVNQFIAISQTHTNDLFHQYWNDQKEQVSGEQMKISDVVKIWKKALDDCTRLIESLRSRSIRLPTVEMLLAKYSTKQTLTENMRNLEIGICECIGKPRPSDQWINSCIQRMYQYQSLCQHASAALAFLHLKECLELTGDFSIVDKLASEFTNSVQDKSLEYIDDSVVETGEFLKEISCDQSKMECLKVFINCQSIVNWIRNETKDVGDLQNFVTIAITTAAGGEDVYTRDRLSNLRTVGIGFATLIYKLPQDCGYRELVKRCNSLWEALSRDKKLPELMAACNTEQEWYQSVKDTQGSVEKSSFDKMKNIKKYGYYTIGSRTSDIHSRLQDVIRLDLERSNKQLTQWRYTLDELRDLESKLVLITSQDSEESGEVDLFMKTFNSVCRISEVLIQLQKDGQNEYMNWELKVHCRTDDLVAKLGDIARSMEKDLDEWKTQIGQQRQLFYHLSYYTTIQLLTLRRELGCYKEDSHSKTSIKPEVVALLQSISRHITAENVKSDLCNIIALYMYNEQNESSQESAKISTVDGKEHKLANSSKFDTNQSKQNLGVSKILSKIMNDEATSHLPKPLLTKSELTDTQQAILANIKQNNDFSTNIILLAFDRCAKADDEDVIEEWCLDHLDDYPYPDSDNESDRMSSHSDDHDDDMSISTESTMDYEGSTHEHVPEDSYNNRVNKHVRITEHVIIDESHPIVCDLMDAGFDLESSIEAVTLYPNDVTDALQYLDEGRGKGGFLSSELTAKEMFDSPSDELLEIVSDGFSLEEPILEKFQRQDSAMSDGSQTLIEDIEISKLETSIQSYLTLQELGMFLKELGSNYEDSVSFKRPFPDGLKVGECNLLVVPPEVVLSTVISLYMYMKDDSLPMPKSEEVLICNKHTTLEEVTLLWKRAMGDPNKFKIFCLVHAENLSYQICDKSLKSLSEVSQGKTDYKLVVICSNEGQEKSHMVSKLQLYNRPVTSVYSRNEFSSYLKKHFTRTHHGISASDIDPERSYVRVVLSERAGMGKSHYISTLKKELDRKLNNSDNSIVVPIHGPVVTADSIIDGLRRQTNCSKPTIFHFDVAPSILWQVDSILFSLLILQSLCDKRGRMWRCYPTHMYVIEATVPKSERVIARRTLSFLNLLPSMHCVSPRTVYNHLCNNVLNNSVRTMDQNEFKSQMFQRVFQYLRRHIGRLELDLFHYQLGSVESTPKACLEVLLGQCGVHDPSWSELKHFIWFLDSQIKASEKSIFCNETVVGDVMAGFKTFVVKFMIRMSKDFATSSLKGEVAIENAQEDMEIEDDLEEYQIDTRKQWEQSYHPYLFFNEDGISITFVGFNANRQGDLLDPITESIIERNAMTPQLYTGLQRNQVDLSEKYQLWDKAKMIFKIGMIMGLEWMSDPDESYVLTVDNVVKILAIHMRFRCNIPVVIMGETGCGKTRLIRFMCDLAAQGCKQGGKDVTNMLIMKIHGGTTEDDIVKHVIKAEKVSVKNREQHNIDTVLFFDEANTTEAIGLIKEVMCDRRINGRSIKENVKFIAACNPYKKHSDDMIKKLESAGLGFYVKVTETQQKLGKIPLRQLVYRVLDLPPSMRPLVYDFGQLNNSTEKDYTKQIVKGRCRKINSVKDRPDIIDVVSHVLAWSQAYMRNRKDECSFVSLRDVERAMIVFRYFCEKADQFQELVSTVAKQEGEDVVDGYTRALILSLSVCYHARLQVRDKFEIGVVQQFSGPLACKGIYQFHNEMRWSQEVLLSSMRLGSNIAKNAALRENVFMMVICIELRIPLFLVGKPGSSKSLAKSIVSDSMLGRTSESSLLKDFKEVHLFSYQCSQLSTPESVIEIFNTAKMFQKEKDTSTYVSVVVLDEVGLAEDSPNLPLKALHPLLEDGTEGGDGNNIVVNRQERVAFIGISNWALDPAKMNRGVMVTRGDPDEDELVLSAKGICSNSDNDPVKARLEPYFKPLASAYKEICEVQEKEGRAFFGLRDFYSLIKMLYWMCQKCQCPPTATQLEHVVKRNFGGYFNTFEIFTRNLGNLSSTVNVNISRKQHKLLSPDCSPLGLIKTSLSTKDISWHGENRYLLFLTENYAALEVIKHHLNLDVLLMKPKVKKAKNDTKEELIEDSNVTKGKENKRKIRKMEPFVLFGSSFPKDREYTQVCRNINQIKICMETGRTVILLNLENLYESLYDLLNQYYLVSGGTRYVDLGLQTHRVKCRVHDDFKLILIAEKETVYEKFPTPLINRLEKHFVLTKTILFDWQKDVLERVEDWIKDFSEMSDSNTTFTKQDAFVGFQPDTPASVVFKATEDLKQSVYFEVDEEHVQTQEWKDDVFKCSCDLLLQMASPDALIRLQKSRLAHLQKELSETYFFDQCHASLEQFLKYNLECEETTDGLLMQVTTQSHLLPPQDIKELSEIINIQEKNLYCFLLQEFDTELDFSNKVNPAFIHSDDQTDKLLIIQCDSGHLYGDLVACARYRIDDEREKSFYQRKSGVTGVTHVLFIINLPRTESSTTKNNSSFVGFQGGSWKSAHIDDIKQPSKEELTLDEARSAPINELFYNMQFVSNKQETASEESNVHDEVTSELLPGGTHVEDDDIQIMDLEDNMEIEEDTIEQMEEDVVQTIYQLSVNEEEDPSPMEVSPIKHHKPQCYRLYYCIQAAVAKATGGDDKKKEWAAQRVRFLLNLIPEKPLFPLDDQTFYGALVKQIKTLLKERDEIKNDKQWVLDEALNGRHLQSGGTFQNVLTRRLDEVIIPLFAAIIAFIDQYSNLNLVNTKQLALQDLWLRIFTNHDLCHFSYEQIAMGNTGDVNPGTIRQTVSEFKCKFPFFWLIKESIDAKWDQAYNITGSQMQNLHRHLCELLADTSIAHVLSVIKDSATIDEFVKLYYLDYLTVMHRVSHNMMKEEYEILLHALSTICDSPDFGNESVLDKVVAFHVVFHSFRQEIMWFGHLTSYLPGILVKLQKHTIENCSDKYFEVHFHAVSVALESLSIPLDKKDRELIPSKLLRIQQCQNSIDSILMLNNKNVVADNIRCSWHSIKLIQSFVEHVVLKYHDLASYARRLSLYMKKDCDFSRPATLQYVIKVLKAMDNEIENKKEYKQNTNDIRGLCHSFFMEVVSSLCFGQSVPPEEDLIKELLKLVVTENNKTREFSYSEKVEDKVPVIRSFLLQLLMEHNSETVKRGLDVYISKTRSIIKDDESLCLLCVQCFEDAIYKQYHQMSLNDRVVHALEILNDGIPELHTVHPSVNEQFSLQYFEGVAKLRYALIIVAELLHSQKIVTKGHRAFSREASLLLGKAKECCLSVSLNSDDAGPGIFLVKQIFKQFGKAFLVTLTSDQSMEWIVPVRLRTSDDEPQGVDSFVFHKSYDSLRTAVTDAVYGEIFDEIGGKAQKLSPNDVISFALAIYKVITLSSLFTDESRQVDESIKSEMKKLTTKCVSLNRPLKRICNSLIQGTHCSNLEPMVPRPRQTPENQLIADVVVHAAIVFCGKDILEILKPFNAIINSPKDLKNAYLPTMPDDSLPEIRRAMGGQFYECPQGHVYFVSECGRPVQEYTCPTCGFKIGGASHKLDPTNRNARTSDITQIGYCLGLPKQRSQIPTPERTLTPASCMILRALLHCAFIWSSCNNENAIEGLLEIVNSQIRPRELPRFFWDHLYQDISLISKATGKSKDEACLLLHLILKDIVLKNLLHSSGITTYATLLAKEAREQWEKHFNDAYIQPILRRLDQSLDEATKCLLADTKEDCDRLFYSVCEKKAIAKESILPSLWTYRSRITLEHLLQMVKNQRTCPVLLEFLNEEPTLRATQYITGIVQLQQQLYQLCNKRLDKSEAAKTTVGDFIRNLKIDYKQSKFREQFMCVQNALNLVKNKLLKYARVKVSPEYLDVVWDETLPLVYLIPTLTGPGTCTVALIDLLVGAHNDFIEKCHSQLQTKQKKSCRKVKVPVSHVQKCHLLNYEHHLMPIILSHCQYSLKYGQGQNVKYDLPALEKHLIDRFVHGRPFLVLEIPQVVFRKDIYTTTTLVNIRKKVKPQVSLDDRECIDIISELRTIKSLRECLDVIDIVVGFLSSSGDNSSKRLAVYIEQSLKMKDRFNSKKALEYCNLGHVLSLWHILSVEVAKRLTLVHQEPFESINEAFLKPLSMEEEEKLNMFLRSIDVTPFLGILYEFIETYIRHLEPTKNDWPLAETLQVYLEEYSQQELPSSIHVVDRFPESITVGQAVTTWKEIVKYQHRYETEIKLN